MPPRTPKKDTSTSTTNANKTSPNNNNNNTNTNTINTELFDLGRDRFDHDTALPVDRDYALNTARPVVVRSGRAPKGLENKVYEWSTFQFTTEERDEREELKGDLHEGQLHRQNRAAREGGDGGGNGMMGGGGDGRRGGGVEGGMGRGGRGGGRGGRGGGEGGSGRVDSLRAGMKPEIDAPPMAKGFAEELDKSMFWDGPII